MDFSLSSLMSDYYLSSLYRQNNVLGNVQYNMADTAKYPSFQSVFAASLKGQDLQDLLTTQFPGAKYHVMDTSKIMPSKKESQENKEERTEWMLQQVRKHHL